MVAVSLLGGAALRVALGPLTDRVGARWAGLLGMWLTTLPLLLGWLWADRFDRILLVGMMQGVAGASFAAALPLAGRWYPRGSRVWRWGSPVPATAARRWPRSSAPPPHGLGLVRRVRPGARPAHGDARLRQLQRRLPRLRARRGPRPGVALAYASRGWEGIFIDGRGGAAEPVPSPLAVLAQPRAAS